MNATCKICGHGEQWHSKRHGCERWVGSLVCHCREFVASAEESERPRYARTLEKLLAEAEAMCRCSDDYTKRGRTAPDCQAHDFADLIRDALAGESRDRGRMPASHYREEGA